MEVLNISASIRDEAGSRAVKHLRRQGKVPCIIYGFGIEKAISLDSHDFKNLVYSPDFKLVELELDGEKIKCILKDVQFHPVTDQIIHADFMALTEGRKLKVEVPVRFSGQPSGVSQGGKLQQKIRRISIKTTPEQLIDHVEVDVSNLDLGHSIRVRDIDVSDEIEILNPPGIPLASVEIPRALRSLEALEEEEAAKAALAAAEGEGVETAPEERGEQPPAEEWN